MTQKTSRRDLLKRTLIVFGAAALVQPHGGVLSFAAQEAPKKDGGSLKQPNATSGTATRKKGKNSRGKKGSGKAEGKVRKTPKKDG